MYVDGWWMDGGWMVDVWSMSWLEDEIQSQNLIDVYLHD